VAALRQYLRVGIAQLLEQVSGALDIGEEQRDRSCRQVTHSKHLFAPIIPPAVLAALEAAMGFAGELE